MTDEEFGDLTDGMLAALIERKKMEERKEYIRIGILAASFINHGFSRPETAAQVMDFVPEELKEKPVEDLSDLSPEEQAARMINMFAKRSFSRS